jgi:small subunit ribosomal protein S1
MKQLTDDPWESVPSKFPVGSRVSGKTMSVTDYGAFIKLEDGVEGLVHISEMTWNRKIKHPSKVVEVGDTVEAEVLSIDTENRRISLGMKQIEPNPWDLVAENYPVGSLIEGKVRTLTDFGAFIGLEEGIDGLIHVSDISWIQKVNHPSEILKKGDTVNAVVMSVDKERERLSLGLKQLTPNPWEELVKNHPAGAVVTGKVVNHADFGTFVELAEGVEGLIHISEMELDDGQNAEESFPPGSEVTVKILNIDPEERKVSLSINAVKEGQEAPHYSNYMNAGGGGGGTLGDILGESLAAHKVVDTPSAPEAIEEQDEQEVTAQEELDKEDIGDPEAAPGTKEASGPEILEELKEEEDQEATAEIEELEEEVIKEPADDSEPEKAAGITEEPDEAVEGSADEEEKREGDEEE